VTLDDVIETLLDSQERVDEGEEAFVCLIEAGIELYDAENGVQGCEMPMETAQETDVEKAAFDLSAICSIPCPRKSLAALTNVQKSSAGAIYGTL
jgi:hypothetical protein